MLEAAGVIKQLITVSELLLLLLTALLLVKTRVCVLVHVCPFGIIH